MLTHQQTAILESAWEILDKVRGCKDFNESHDLTIGDACSVLSDFLDWNYERDSQNQPHSLPSVHLASLESFNHQ